MKYPALLMIILTTFALVSCVSTTDTVNPPVEETLKPLKPETSEPSVNGETDDSNLELIVPTKPGATELEPLQTSPIESEENPMEPLTTEEKSTMTPSNNEVSNPDKLPQVQMAINDLAKRLTKSIDNIEIITVELVTWPNSGMGCPQPGMAYTQVPVDGLLIRLSVEGAIFNYHSGGSREPFLCQPSLTVKATQPTINLDDFITLPPGNMDD